MAQNPPAQGALQHSQDWRAEALDVRGPARSPRFAGAGRQEGHGDRGSLWIAAGVLYFSGRAHAWAVPLSYLDVPRADLAGVLRFATVGDRRKDISFRLAGGASAEAGLRDAIRKARVGEPDVRDRRALDDLLALLGPDLQRLAAEIAADGY